MIRHQRIEQWAVFDKTDTVEHVIDQFWTNPFEYLITEIDEDVYGVARLTTPLFDQLGFQADHRVGDISHLLTRFGRVDVSEFEVMEAKDTDRYIILEAAAITGIHDPKADLGVPVAAAHYVDSPTDFLLQPTVDQAFMAVAPTFDDGLAFEPGAEEAVEGAHGLDGNTPTAASDDLVWITDAVEPDPLVAYGVAQTESPFRLETVLTFPDPDRAPLAEVVAGRAANLEGQRVDFEIEVRGPARLARVLDDGGTEPTEGAVLSSGPRTCRLDGCDPFRFEVTPTSHGTVAVIVSMFLDRQPVLDGHELTFRVIPQDLLTTVFSLEAPAETGERTNVGWARSVDLQLRSGGPDLLEIVTKADDVPAFRPARSAHDIETVVNDTYARLDQLSSSYQGGNDGRSPGTGVLAEVARLGAALHEALFGHPDDASVEPGTIEAGSYLAERGRNGGAADLYIDLKVPTIPWAIVYDAAFAEQSPPTTDEEVDPLGFWGTRFRLARAARRRGGDDPRSRGAGAVQVQAFVNRDITPGVAVERQTKVLGDLARDRGVEVTTGFTVSEFESWVSSAKDGTALTDFLYLYCHATAAARLSPEGTLIGETSDDQARIELADATVLSVSEMLALSRKRLVGAPPLAMINACSAGREDAAFPNAFVDHFVNRWGMRALVASDSLVPAVLAAEYGDVFLRRFLDPGTGVAEAVRGSAHTLVVDHQNPLGLLFSVHGDPALRLEGAA